MVCMSHCNDSSKLSQRVQQITCQPLFTRPFTAVNLKCQYIRKYTYRYEHMFKGGYKTFFKRMQIDDNY